MQPEPASAMMERAETIEELFAALESPLLGYALRLAGERGVAEDLVQEAFMRLHKQFAQMILLFQLQMHRHLMDLGL